MAKQQARGYYSLIQFCPDLSRLEAANIGVLLFCPEMEFLKARMATHNARIGRFFGPIRNTDWAQVDAAKDALVERLERYGSSFREPDDLRRFVATRANQVVLTAPRPMKVRDPEADLARLFEELVGPERAPRSRATSTRLQHSLARTFREREVAQYVELDVEVGIPTHQHTLRVPFAFQNGRFNLVLPTAFNLKRLDSIEKKACKIAIQGEYVRKTPHPDRGDMDMIVVGEFGGNQSAAALVEDILAVPELMLVRADEVDPLIELIQGTAKPAQGPSALGF